ncbi:ABC transporter ATP-binding protein [Hyphomicrobium sp. 99]|uniref:ABC transporter ATP-binding protein n=1 Tax=Hyphomicrobium sp. 99 TaxID=1163419 RepID=UPI000695E5EB|nr:ABC transporter ATP-binding protein [Hyphomicrobium sp. 99]
MSQISVRNLDVVIDGHPVLRQVNLDVASGEFCVVTGPSGSGKTTFIRLLLSQIRPTAGEISIDGTPIAPFPAPDRGVVFQDYSVFPHKTALQNVLVGPQFKRSRFLGRIFGQERKKLIEQAMQALSDVGLAQAASKYPSQLSGGMRQRLAIAQALICRPKVLLLDEPFGALDPENRAQLHRVVLKLWRESRTTIVMVTHDLAEAQTLATRLVSFGFAAGGGGTIVSDGSPQAGSAVVTSFTQKSGNPANRQKKRKYR